jgi:alpha-D-xyloside xylohydrolase
MDVSLSDTAITYKVLGGVIDLYTFVGPTPQAVVSQYTALIGRPAMMPYWSLGYRKLIGTFYVAILFLSNARVCGLDNCKYGYTSIGQVEEVVANYSAANIPLDTQWMDIDYKPAYKDFTTDPTNFPVSEVKSFVDTLHANGQHFVPIVDPGIMVEAGYEAYEQGLAKDLFVKDVSGSPYLGQVWPGPTYFPDFMHPSAQSYWTTQLQGFYDLVQNDGLWIDMNEVSNFCNDDGAGQVCANSAPDGCPAPGKSQTDCCLVCSTVDPSNKYDFPAYSINNVKGKLSAKTMPMSGVHYGNVSVYDAHNLYGLTEQIATNVALAEVRIVVLACIWSLV